MLDYMRPARVQSGIRQPNNERTLRGGVALFNGFNVFPDSGENIHGSILSASPKQEGVGIVREFAAQCDGETTEQDLRSPCPSIPP